MVAMGSVSQMHTQQLEQQKMALAARAERVIRLTIADNGCGLETGRLEDGTDRPSWGLLKMSERADAIGGWCWLKSQLGQGANVTVEVAQ